MKKLILISIIIGVGWYGNYLYKQRSETIPEQQTSSDSAYKKSIKCITRDGRTFYGDVPQGTECIQEKTIEGVLTLVPSKTSGRVAITTSFKCDGRTHCSQMTSCEEATFFLRNCPNVKMDGNNDGIPCEKQWCNR